MVAKRCIPRGELRSNDIFSQFYILRGQGQGWGSFDTPLLDVGEVWTPACRVTLKYANCIDVLCH